MQTLMLLMAQHGKAVVPLEDICEDYLSLSRTTANQRAKGGSLPLPAFRCGESQKAKWLVNLTDLALYLDTCRAKALEDSHGVAA